MQKWPVKIVLSQGLVHRDAQADGQEKVRLGELRM